MHLCESISGFHWGVQRDVSLFLITSTHPNASSSTECEYPCQPLYYLEIMYRLVLFQTNPTYLAKLIFQMPQNKSTKFMDSVIFTLYNYASNQREEYLLLRLFKTALQEEIKYEQMAARPGPRPTHSQFEIQACPSSAWPQLTLWSRWNTDSREASSF